jgi:hypothetical protein
MSRSVSRIFTSRFLESLASHARSPPCPSPFANWIEELYAEGITGGCGVGISCPNNPNTRGQMAVFLVKTFGLLLYGP